MKQVIFSIIMSCLSTGKTMSTLPAIASVIQKSAEHEQQHRDDSPDSSKRMRGERVAATSLQAIQGNLDTLKVNESHYLANDDKFDKKSLNEAHPKQASGYHESGHIVI